MSQRLARWPLIGLVLVLLAAARACALRISSIEVPPAVMNGSQVTLVCRHELQGAQLYSVKWYKNFVEFYRFQPATATSDSGAPPTSANGPTDSQQQVRHEFELAGINLNLSKSNATHVHLRHTSLASEATYKCEVSADAPSFATVSLERPMKVYVLQRQRPTLVDNSESGTHLSALAHPAQADSGHSSRPQPLYGVNDSINLTCTAGPARPAAKLTWLINGQPLADSSKWLSGSQHLATANGLTETRQTLAFRIQPSHLLRNGTSRPDVLNITCLSRLSIEFSSATTIHVSGGKSSAVKRRQQQQTAALPLPESLNLDFGASELASEAPSAAAPPPFRWPRPLVGGAGRRAGASELVWPMPSTDAGETSADIEWSRRTGKRGRLYTSSQQHDQANQIEWLLRLSRPNELEPPLVEARSRSEESEPEDQMDPEAYTTDWSNDPPANTEYPPVSGQADQPSQDYELNEQVEFTCSPRGLSPVNLANLRYIRSKWLINDKEVTQNKVNAFDGIKFYYKEYRRLDAIRPTHLPAVLSHRLPPQNAANPSALADNRNGSLEMFAQTTPGAGGDTTQLLVEFSAALLQLKELSLKCLTLVDQPLIELASEPLLVSTTGGSKFVEVDPMQHRQRGIVSRKHQNQSRNRHTLPRQHGASSLAARSTPDLALVSCCSLLMVLLVIKMAFA